MNTTQQKIESLLFFKNEPVSYTWLGKQLSLSIDEISQQVLNMNSFYENRGISLIVINDVVVLMTSEVSSDLINTLSKNDDEKELSKQALETLSIILYKSEITKSEIDYIRGVNSVFILRNLLIRGLISKKENKDDKRSPLYVCTPDLFSYLNMTSINDLPHLAKYQEKLENLEQNYQSDQIDSKDE